MRKGIPVSPGVAVAPAYCVDAVLARREPNKVDVSAVTGEVGRFDAACTAAGQALDKIVARVAREVGDEQASIFRAHRLLLRDPALINKVKSTIIDQQVDAETALHQALEEYTVLFNQIRDEYLKERMADVRDVVGRIMAHLAMQNHQKLIDVNEAVVMVAPEILPSQAMMFDRMQVAGTLTETGGATGPAAILARSLGIPAVSGLRGILREVQTGDLLALDGREGHVYLNPGPEVEAAYRKLQREYGHLRDRLIENRDQEPVSA